MSVYHLRTHCPSMPEGARFPAIKVTDGCELLCAGNQTQVLLKNILFCFVFVFFLILNLLYFLCMVFCTYVCVPHACSAHAVHKRALDSPGTGVTDAWVVSARNPTQVGPLKEQQVLLTSKPSLATVVLIFLLDLTLVVILLYVTFSYPCLYFMCLGVLPTCVYITYGCFVPQRL